VAYYAPSTAKLVLTQTGLPRNSPGDLQISPATDWAASSRSISLAKNEKRAVQLVISTSKDLNANISYAAPAGVTIQPYFEHYVTLNAPPTPTICVSPIPFSAESPGSDGNAGEKWFDALVPMSFGQTFSVSAGEYRPLWLSVYANAAAASGKITITLFVDDASLNHFEQDYELDLAIRSFTLPTKPTLSSFFGMYGGLFDNFDSTGAGYRNAITMGVGNKISSETYSLSSLNNPAYGGAWLAQSSFWVLPVNRNDATHWTASDEFNLTNPAVTGAINLAQSHPEINWAVYVLDEPSNLTHYQKTNARAAYVKNKYSVLKTLVTEQITPYYSGLPAGIQLTNIDYFDPLAPIFYGACSYCDNGNPNNYDPAPERPFFYNIDTRKNGGTGENSLLFGSTLVDFKAARHRVVPWIANSDNFSGVQYWIANYFTRYKTSFDNYPNWDLDENGIADTADNFNAWTQPRLYSLLRRNAGVCQWDSGNGWGYLFYPGWSALPQEVKDKLGPKNDVIPSIRLELWGEGMQDYEYLACAGNAGVDVWSDPLVAAIIGGLPYNDPALQATDYEAALNSLASKIQAKGVTTCGGGPPIG